MSFIKNSLLTVCISGYIVLLFGIRGPENVCKIYYMLNPINFDRSLNTRNPNSNTYLLDFPQVSA